MANNNGQYRVAQPRKQGSAPNIPIPKSAKQQEPEDEVVEDKYEIAKSRATTVRNGVGSGFADVGNIFSWFTRPRSLPRNNPHAISHSDRAIFLLGALVTTGWSAFLNYLAMVNFVPAFRTTKPGAQVSIGAIAATVVLSIILFAVEYVIWKGNHSPVEWTFFAVIFAFDIWVNLVGTQGLLDVYKLYWPWEFTPAGDRPDMASCICLVVAIPSAVLPEWLWRRARA